MTKQRAHYVHWFKWSAGDHSCVMSSDIKMIKYYLDRGYPFNQLKKHMLRGYQYTQDELLEVKHKEATKPQL